LWPRCPIRLALPDPATTRRPVPDSSDLHIDTGPGPVPDDQHWETGGQGPSPGSGARPPARRPAQPPEIASVAEPFREFGRRESASRCHAQKEGDLSKGSMPLLRGHKYPCADPNSQDLPPVRVPCRQASL